MTKLEELNEIVHEKGFSTEFINNGVGFKFIDNLHTVTVYHGRKGLKVVCTEINTMNKWLSILQGLEEPESIYIPDNVLKYSVDGSYNHAECIASYAWVCSDGTYESNIIIKPVSRQIDGEYMSCIQAIKDAISKNQSEIVIEYDYSGIAFIANGCFEAKTPLSKTYKEMFDKLTKENNLNVIFSKVRGHHGVETNETVDSLAKRTIAQYVCAQK